jgi:hypothetical protein
MGRFRDFVARKLPVTKVRIGSRVCENANNFANIEASYRIRGSDR